MLAKTEHLLDKLPCGYTYDDFHHSTAVQALANPNRDTNLYAIFVRKYHRSPSPFLEPIIKQ
ncbi:hypothetical protein BT69DRAFT_1284600 [Atractiella rhizophila]|nr:hypothetical protein BT69DRAFT_1284600 [Atractiella rhizophila]